MALQHRELPGVWDESGFLGGNHPQAITNQSKELFASNYSVTQTSQGGLWPNRLCRKARSKVFLLGMPGNRRLAQQPGKLPSSQIR